MLVYCAVLALVLQVLVLPVLVILELACPAGQRAGYEEAEGESENRGEAVNRILPVGECHPATNNLANLPPCSTSLP